MHKAGALARQLHLKEERSWAQKVKFGNVYWVALCVLGSILGWISQNFFEKSLRAVLEENQLAIITGPRVYFEYFWAFYFLLKCLSSYLLYSNNFSILSLKDKAIQDLELSVAFFIEYRIVKYIYLNYEFKISGHCLILVLGSYVIDAEGDLSERYLEKNSLQPLCKYLVLLNYYFFTWTSTVYHSFPESFSGTLLGLGTIYLIKTLLSR